MRLIKRKKTPQNTYKHSLNKQINKTHHFCQSNICFLYIYSTALTTYFTTCKHPIRKLQSTIYKTEDEVTDIFLGKIPKDSTLLQLLVPVNQLGKTLGPTKVLERFKACIWLTTETNIRRGGDVYLWM